MRSICLVLIGLLLVQCESDEPENSSYEDYSINGFEVRIESQAFDNDLGLVEEFLGRIETDLDSIVNLELNDDVLDFFSIACYIC